MSAFDVTGVVSIKFKNGILVELRRFGKCFVYFDGHILILTVIEDGYLSFYYHDVCRGGDYRFREEFVLSLDEMDSIDWVMGDPGYFGNGDFQYALMDALYLLLMDH